MNVSSRSGHRSILSPRTEHHAPQKAPPMQSRVAGTTMSRIGGYLLALLRICLGWVFLWAALDKTFGLGHDTAGKDAWIHGGSPTYGFLHFAATGPFAGMYKDIAGQDWADWLFMLGLWGIGIGLILGMAMRISAVAAAVMLVLMWSVVLPPDNNPFMDDHLIYAIAVLALAALNAGRLIGLGKWWEQQPIVRRHRALI